MSLYQRQLTPREAFERQYVKAVLKRKRPIVEIDDLYQGIKPDELESISAKLNEFRNSREYKDWLVHRRTTIQYVGLPEVVLKIKTYHLEKVVVWMIEEEISVDVLNKLISDITLTPEGRNLYLEKILTLAEKYFRVMEERIPHWTELTKYHIYDGNEYLGTITKELKVCFEVFKNNVFIGHWYEIPQPMCPEWSLK